MATLRLGLGVERDPPNSSPSERAEKCPLQSGYPERSGIAKGGVPMIRWPERCPRRMMRPRSRSHARLAMPQPQSVVIGGDSCMCQA